MTTRRITLTAATVGQLDLALAVATLAVLEVVHTIIPDGGGLATAVALVPFVAPLAVRHRWPLAALLASVAVVLIQKPFGQILTSLNGDQAVPLILSYGAGAWLPTRPAVTALASALVAADRLGSVFPGGGGATTLSQVPGPTFYVVMLLVPTWCVAQGDPRATGSPPASSPSWPRRRSRSAGMRPRRRSSPSASGSASSCTTSSPTASARWSSRPAARGCCCAPTGNGHGSR